MTSLRQVISETILSGQLLAVIIKNQKPSTKHKPNVVTLSTISICNKVLTKQTQLLSHNKTQTTQNLSVL